tara:strand:- start:639 stop:1424 length:786 start_codon:yes stop_codon:yes gene_type:complete
MSEQTESNEEIIPKSKESENNSNKSSIDKLREDLFDYRIDIKSYIKNLNTIMISGSIIISVLAFFGYNKIENIEQTILEKANKRLAVTDSILSQIDQQKIDSLNTLIVTKEKEYLQTISNFEKIIFQNKELEMKLLKSLPENDRTESKNDSYIEEYPTDYFEIRPFKTAVADGESVNVYLVFQDNIEFTDKDYISLKIYPKGRNILWQHKDYKINSKLNKLSFGFRKFENYKDYKIEIAFFKMERNNTYRKCYVIENIKLK